MFTKFTAQRRRKARVLAALLKASETVGLRSGRQPGRWHATPRIKSYQEIRLTFPMPLFGFDQAVVDKFFKKNNRKSYYPFRNRNKL